MNKVHPKIVQRILRVSLDKLTEAQHVRIAKFISALIRRSRGHRPKTQHVIDVLSWALLDSSVLRALQCQQEKSVVSGTKATPFGLELITNSMNELARELGAMGDNDPRKAGVAAELSQLVKLRRSVRLPGDPVIGQSMHELAREMATLKPGDPRRAQIVQAIMQLSPLAK